MRNLVRVIPGLAAALLVVGTAAAQGQVTKIMIGDSATATVSSPTQPAGTSSVWVLYDYQGASDSDFTVVVQAPIGGVVVYSKTESHSGTDTAAVEVTGEDVYANLTDTLVEYADEADGNITKVQTQSQVNEWAGQLASNVGTMSNLASLLEAIDDPVVDTGDLADVVQAVQQMTSLVQQMQASSDDEVKRAKAQDMQPYVDDTMAAARRLAAATVTGVAWPTSPSDNEEGAYNVQVKVGGSTSRSEPMWIYGAQGDSKAAQTSLAPTGPAVEKTVAPPTSRPNGATARPGATTSTGTGAGGTTGSVAPGATQRIVPVNGPTATKLPPGVALPTAAPGESAPVAVGQAQTQLETQDNPGGAQPQATWTLPAQPNGKVPVDDPGSAGGTTTTSAGGGSGPNVMMLGLGLLALVAVAIFLRSRM